MNGNPIDICVDFDGTCVAHEFPKVGKDIGAIPVLKELVANGHRLILFTMRSNSGEFTRDSGKPEYPPCVPEVHKGAFLDDAVNWFKQNDIPLFGVQQNPEQTGWTSSPKAYGQLYIDDAALGAPLIYGDGRPYIDWKATASVLYEMGLIKNLALAVL